MKSVSRRSFLETAIAAAGIGCLVSCETSISNESDQQPPNVIFILSDDLGWGDLGCYGQEMIKTPNLDRMAAGGMRFTDFYAGGAVCAPSRCTLLTGKHTGHARIRGNKTVPLREEDTTIAEVMKKGGYKNAGIGKWGQGNEGTSGDPVNKGFDYWFGYLDRGHAHNYYTDYLWRNSKRVDLSGEEHSHNLFTDESLSFIRENKDRPFFLYLAYTMPHANNEEGWENGNGMQVPGENPYADRDWPELEKGYAGMVHHLDKDVGRILDLLEDLGIAENTAVFFTSDNGPHCEGGFTREFFPEGENVVDAHDPLFFDSNGPYRGIKRDLYEGGIRMPMIAYWPGEIEAGSVCSEPLAFWDVMPTLADIAGVDPPTDTDGISFLPAMTGGNQKSHDYLYWEEYDSGVLHAVRQGKWKLVRLDPEWESELYNLEDDPGERKNVAAEYPELVEKMAAIIDEAHEEPEDVDWFKKRRAQK